MTTKKNAILSKMENMIAGIAGSPCEVVVLGKGLLLNEEAIFAEAGSAYDAAVKVSKDWMASQGLPTNIYKITQI